MKKTFDVKAKSAKAHFTCQYVNREEDLAYVVQGTLVTSKGRRTAVEVDFSAQTVCIKNRLFKVKWLEFTEVPYVE